MINIFNLAFIVFLAKTITLSVVLLLIKEDTTLFVIMDDYVISNIVTTIILRMLSSWETDFANKKSKLNKSFKKKLGIVYAMYGLSVIYTIANNTDVINMIHAAAVIISLIIIACFVMHQFEKISETA